jgi:rfaE bifunctional protein kinase chain/domain
VNSKLIETLLEGFPKVRVTVVGDVMLDRYHWGTVTRISPEAPVPVVNLQRTTLAAGGAANVAANVAGLGASAKLFGVIGSDMDGDILRAELERCGVSPANLFAVEGLGTIVKTRIVAHSQHIVRLDQEFSDGLGMDDETAFGDAIETELASSDLLIVSDYAKGLLSERLLTRLITACRDSRKPVLVDPKGKDFRKYAGATLITPNQREALEASGLDDPADIDLAAGRLVRDLGLGSALITQGEAGMTLYDADGSALRFEARARQVYDVTGAGDTVIAALGTALAARFELSQSVDFANLAAGLVVEQVGTTVISRPMLAEYMREHPQ